MKVYLAGPLFTAAEREFNRGVASVLREFKVEVFLPQEFPEQSVDSLGIFLADTEAIKECDVLIANLDGADPDSGTSWELGYAFGIGKKIYWYRTDFRLGGDFFTSSDRGSGKVNLMLSQSAEYIDVKLLEPKELTPVLVAHGILDVLGAP